MAVLLILALSTTSQGCSRQSDGEVNGRRALPSPVEIDIVNLEVTNFSFLPDQLTLKTRAASPTQALTFINKSDTVHNFSIDSLDIDIDIRADPRPLTAPNFFESPGTFEFFCKFHRDRGMVGTIEVQN